MDGHLYFNGYFLQLGIDRIFLASVEGGFLISPDLIWPMVLADLPSLRPIWAAVIHLERLLSFFLTPPPVFFPAIPLVVRFAAMS